jgi:hypothetical protein
MTGARSPCAYDPWRARTSSLVGAQMTSGVGGSDGASRHGEPQGLIGRRVIGPMRHQIAPTFALRAGRTRPCLGPDQTSQHITLPQWLHSAATIPYAQ